MTELKIAFLTCLSCFLDIADAWKNPDGSSTDLFFVLLFLLMMIVVVVMMVVAVLLLLLQFR